MEQSVFILTDFITGEDLTHTIAGAQVKGNALIVHVDDGSKPLTQREQAKLERERIKAIKARIKADIEELKQQLKDLRK